MSASGAPALRRTREVGLLSSLAVLGVAALLFFPELGARAFQGGEYRWGQIVREMLAGGSFFWPTIHGAVYFDKPLGSYWLVAVAAWLHGGLDETATRLPSAWAGLLAVGCVFGIARRLYDNRSAVLAGLILASSYAFTQAARTAAADAQTVAGVLLALWIYLRCERRPRGGWLMALFAVMAATSHMKGLLGFALPLLVIGVDSLLGDGLRQARGGLLRGSLRARAAWLQERVGWLASWQALLGLGLYFAPFAASLLVTGSAEGMRLVLRENLLRYFQPFDHRGPIALYSYTIFALQAPWSVFLPAALWRAHLERAAVSLRQRSDRFSLCFFWSIFVFFTLSGSRRGYYLLPILPAAALLVARLLWTRAADLTPGARRLRTLGYALLVALWALLGGGLLPPKLFFPPPWNALPLAPAHAFAGVGWLMVLLGLGFALRTGRLRVRVSVVAAACISLCFYFFIVALPAVEVWRPSKPFALRVNQRLGPELPGLALYQTSGPDFYLARSVLPKYERVEALRQAVARGEVHWVIAPREDLARARLPGREVDAELSAPWELPRRGEREVLFHIGPAHGTPGGILSGHEDSRTRATRGPGPLPGPGGVR